MRLLAKNDEDAERLISDIWLALERKKLPSPGMKIKSLSQTVLIELYFKEQHQETLLRSVLSGYRRLTVI